MLSDHEGHCPWSCAYIIYVTANCPHPVSLSSEAAWQSHKQHHPLRTARVLLKTPAISAALRRCIYIHPSVYTCSHDPQE